MALDSEASFRADEALSSGERSSDLDRVLVAFLSFGTSCNLKPSPNDPAVEAEVECWARGRSFPALGEEFEDGTSLRRIVSTRSPDIARPFSWNAI